VGVAAAGKGFRVTGVRWLNQVPACPAKLTQTQIGLKETRLGLHAVLHLLGIGGGRLALAPCLSLAMALQLRPEFAHDPREKCSKEVTTQNTQIATRANQCTRSTDYKYNRNGNRLVDRQIDIGKCGIYLFFQPGYTPRMNT